MPHAQGMLKRSAASLSPPSRRRHVASAPARASALDDHEDDSVTASEVTSYPEEPCVMIIAGDTEGQAETLVASIDLSFRPELTVEGTSGVYMMRDSNGKPCAIFKPLDEEHGAKHNPRGNTGKAALTNFAANDQPDPAAPATTNKDVVVGDIHDDSFDPGMGFLREFAAYAVDNLMGGVSNVPCTVVVAIPWALNEDELEDEDEQQQQGEEEEDIDSSRYKVGSLQRFVPDAEEASDFGSGAFSVDDVQRIALLDLRILNCDRHFANILVASSNAVSNNNHKTTNNNNTNTAGSRSRRVLVPIDHGFSFPSVLGQLGRVSLDWLMWPQSREPVTQELKEAITNIDIARDVNVLGELGMPRDAQLAFWMANVLLQTAVCAGLSLFDVGSMVQRQGDRSLPSTLEGLFMQALESCAPRPPALMADESVSLNMAEQLDDKSGALLARAVGAQSQETFTDTFRVLARETVLRCVEARGGASAVDAAIAKLASRAASLQSKPTTTDQEQQVTSEQVGLAGEDLFASELEVKTKKLRHGGGTENDEELTEEKGCLLEHVAVAGLVGCAK